MTIIIGCFSKVEIDEYQNYEKAYGALTEAYKCISKAKMKNTMQQEEKMANLKQKAGLIKKFIQAKKFVLSTNIIGSVFFLKIYKFGPSTITLLIFHSLILLFVHSLF